MRQDKIRLLTKKQLVMVWNEIRFELYTERVYATRDYINHAELVWNELVRRGLIKA